MTIAVVGTGVALPMIKRKKNKPNQGGNQPCLDLKKPSTE